MLSVLTASVCYRYTLLSLRLRFGVVARRERKGGEANGPNRGTHDGPGQKDVLGGLVDLGVNGEGPGWDEPGVAGVHEAGDAHEDPVHEVGDGNLLGAGLAEKEAVEGSEAGGQKPGVEERADHDRHGCHRGVDAAGRAGLGERGAAVLQRDPHVGAVGGVRLPCHAMTCDPHTCMRSEWSE